jgi:hypothetical protein
MDAAWSAGNFGNDDAVEWLKVVIEGGGESTIKDAIECIELFPEDEFLDAVFCSQALAAAEFIAAARGNPAGEDFPEEAAAWLEKNSLEPDDNLLQVTRRAVDRILNNSELKELWQEGCANDEWHLTIIDLRRRLS